MWSLRKIVVPTDFSQTAREALRVARDLAHDPQCELHLLHVVPDALQVPWLIENPGIEYYTKMEASWKTDARKRLEELVAQEGLTSNTVVLAVFLGHPATHIVEYANVHDADLIVMGAHGHSAIERFFLGSVAERVVHRAGRPVLTVPQRTEPRTPATDTALRNEALTPLD